MDIRRFVWRPTKELDLAALREQRAREDARLAERAAGLCLLWPRTPTKPRAGRRSVQQIYEDKLYDLVRGTSDLAGVNKDKPAGWRPGDAILPADVEAEHWAHIEYEAVEETIEYEAVEETIEYEAVETPDSSETPTKRQKRTLDDEVVEWFQSFAEIQRKRVGWGRAQTFACCRRLVPELFGGIHPDTYKKWGKRTGAKRTGRPGTVSAGALTILADICNKYCSKVALSSTIVHIIWQPR